LVITALATLSYAWGMSNFPLESFYAAAARSMSMSWKNFFYGAVDPFGTVTVDKLPGAFWIQALSVRLFGWHYWAVALPQVVAGALTVLVLYRVVRLLAGPKAGLLAACVMAVSPVTALLNRGNVSDSLLVLLTVLAADATVRATVTGRLRTLLLAGLWVGLAFQTKMLQAWLIVPALWATYLVAGPATLRRRLRSVAVASAVMVIVSLSWMSVVSAIPGHDRPYVDGTKDDSLFVQVFVYNGWARVGVHWDASDVADKYQPFQRVGHDENPEVGTVDIRASADRLLVGPFGRDDAWLLPASVLSGSALLVARRSKTRRDLLRAGVILWGGWLVTLGSFFSFGRYINSYYTAALTPAVAALFAVGLAECWRRRSLNGISRAILLAMVPLTTTYAVYLIPRHAGVAWWVDPGAGAVCVVAELTLVWSISGGVHSRRVGGFAVGSAAISMLLVPAITTGDVVAQGLGSFSTPYQSAAATRGTTTGPEFYQEQAARVDAIWDRAPKDRILQAVDTSFAAAPLIMLTGREFLPIGGVTGSNPSPSLKQLIHLVDTGRLSQFYIPVHPPGDDPRLDWVRSHCQNVDTLLHRTVISLGLYNCPSSSHVEVVPPTSQPVVASSARQVRSR
jgi:4-amino-4-deoxy-L-arabinose transferase-like glycosyltransferase